MKHIHTSWGRRGGNHLAKILAKKCSGKLEEVTEKLRCLVVEEEKVEELYGEILMSAKAQKGGERIHGGTGRKKDKEERQNLFAMVGV